MSAKVALELAVFVVFGDGEDIGAETKKVFAEVESFFVIIANDNGIDDAEAFQQGFFMFVGDGGFAAFVDPQDFFGGEGDNKVITQGARLFKKLNVASVDDVVATGDENFFQNIIGWSLGS